MTVVHVVSDDPNYQDANRDKKQKKVAEKLLIGDCDTAEEIALKLIPKYHHEIASAKIKFGCRNRASKVAGEKIPGNVAKASPADRWLAKEDVDFKLVVALDVWNELESRQRYALIDHLLSRCVGVEDETTGEMKYSIRPPQVQEFPEIVERHGKWNDGLAEMGQCMKDK